MMRLCNVRVKSLRNYINDISHPGWKKLIGLSVGVVLLFCLTIDEEIRRNLRKETQYNTIRMKVVFLQNAKYFNFRFN